MRLSGLAVAAVFLMSPVVFAQHSFAGGSSSSSSSSSGSSHSGSSGSSGGSSYSSAGHGSSASSTRGSSSGASRSNHNSSSHGPSGSVIAPATKGEKISPSPSAKNNTSQEKRSFASRVFHHFRKSDRKIAQADRRRPVCKRERVSVPAEWQPEKPSLAQTSLQTPLVVNQAGTGTAADASPSRKYRVNDCAALEMIMMMWEQARRMGAAEDSRQAICSRSDPACGEMTTKFADEAGRYKALQQQYEQCRRRQFGAGNSGYSFGRPAANPFAIN